MNKKILLPVMAVAVIAVIYFVINSNQNGDKTMVPGSDIKNEVKNGNPAGNLGQPPVSIQNNSSTQVSDQDKIVAYESTYESPAGQEKVGFKLSISKDGTITKAVTDVFAVAPISVKRQSSFSESLPQVIVGKKLKD